jgi:DNA-binding XRE family transcriptional regulator
LGEHIRKRRLELGLSQKEAARQLGYCWTAVLNWEKGKTWPSMESIPAIIAFLGYDPFPVPTSLSCQLAAVRRKNGWTIRAAARQLRVDDGTWVGGRRRASWKRHRLIVAAFIQKKWAASRTSIKDKSGELVRATVPGDGTLSMSASDRIGRSDSLG